MGDLSDLRTIKSGYADRVPHARIMILKSRGLVAHCQITPTLARIKVTDSGERLVGREPGAGNHRR
jgi:hypothetical protein